MVKARKTYVVSYYGTNGTYTQAYFQNKAKAEAYSKKVNGHVHFWIDGAEMVRLAKLGYRYDSRLDKAVKDPRVSEFAKTVDTMSAKKRKEMFLDYRMFHTMDDVVNYHKELRK